MRAARVLRTNLVDAVIALIVVAAIAEAALTSVKAPRWELLLFAPLWSLPLLVRRRAPLGAPLLVFAALVAESFVNGRAVQDLTTTFMALLFAGWAVGAYNERNRGAIGAACGIATIALVVANAPNGGGGDLLWTGGFFLLAWVTGVALHQRAEHAASLEERTVLLERRREEEARAAVAEERARIARELHDVVAHSVSVMTVQAGAVRRLLLPEQEREREALETVERTGREALAEMRRLLGVLRETEDAAALEPQPGLDQIERLLERARSAGLPVELTVEGERRALAPGVDLNAYRVVQEALTNALKHSQGATAAVRLRWGADELELEVANDGVPVLSGDGSGHGLVGMRERVNVCGGRLEAGPRPEGGFLVRATLPVESGP